MAFPPQEKKTIGAEVCWRLADKVVGDLEFMLENRDEAGKKMELNILTVEKKGTSKEGAEGGGAGKPTVDAVLDGVVLVPPTPEEGAGDPPADYQASRSSNMEKVLADGTAIRSQSFENVGLLGDNSAHPSSAIDAAAQICQNGLKHGSDTENDLRPSPVPSDESPENQKTSSPPDQNSSASATSHSHQNRSNSGSRSSSAGVFGSGGPPSPGGPAGELVNNTQATASARLAEAVASTTTTSSGPLDGTRRVASSNTTELVGASGGTGGIICMSSAAQLAEQQSGSTTLGKLSEERFQSVVEPDGSQGSADASCNSTGSESDPQILADARDATAARRAGNPGEEQFVSPATSRSAADATGSSDHKPRPQKVELVPFAQYITIPDVVTSSSHSSPRDNGPPDAAGGVDLLPDGGGPAPGDDDAPAEEENLDPEEIASQFASGKRGPKVEKPHGDVKGGKVLANDQVGAGARGGPDRSRSSDPRESGEQVLHSKERQVVESHENRSRALQELHDKYEREVQEQRSHKEDFADQVVKTKKKVAEAKKPSASKEAGSVNSSGGSGISDGAGGDHRKGGVLATAAVGTTSSRSSTSLDHGPTALTKSTSSSVAVGSPVAGAMASTPMTGGTSSRVGAGALGTSGVVPLQDGSSSPKSGGSAVAAPGVFAPLARTSSTTKQEPPASPTKMMPPWASPVKPINPLTPSSSSYQPATPAPVAGGSLLDEPTVFPEDAASRSSSCVETHEEFLTEKQKSHNSGWSNQSQAGDRGGGGPTTLTTTKSIGDSSSGGTPGGTGPGAGGLPGTTAPAGTSSTEHDTGARTSTEHDTGPPTSPKQQREQLAVCGADVVSCCVLVDVCWEWNSSWGQGLCRARGV